MPAMRRINPLQVALAAILCAICSTCLYAQNVQYDPTTTFTYQGSLEQAGEPVSGTVDLTFRLWDSEVDGNAYPQEIFLEDVNVSQGLFTVRLDFGQDVFQNERWLEVDVNGETLSPRQLLTATPFALQTRGLHVDEQRNVGIGTTNPNGATLRLNGDSPGDVGGSLSFQGGTNATLRNPEDGVLEFKFGPFGAQHTIFTSESFQGESKAVHLGINEPNPTLPLALRAQSGGGSVGLTQGNYAGTHAMELTTGDGSRSQASRLVLRGNVDNADIEFLRGAAGAEQEMLRIDGSTGNVVAQENLIGLNRVGVNTASPEQALHIGALGNLQIGDLSQSRAGIIFGEDVFNGGAAGYDLIFTGPDWPADAQSYETWLSGGLLSLRRSSETSSQVVLTDEKIETLDSSGNSTFKVFSNGTVYADKIQMDPPLATGVDILVDHFAPALQVTNQDDTARAAEFGGEVYINDDLIVSGTVSKSGGSFRIDHPLDPENKYLRHSFVESPDMMNVYNGNVILGEGGKAWVELPNYFEALNKDFRYQLTALGAPGPNLHVSEKISDNRFKISGGAQGMEVSWQVTGIRHDPYAEKHRIQVVEKKNRSDN